MNFIYLKKLSRDIILRKFYLFIIVSLLPLSAIFGQNTTVTLTENQIPLIKAFESIEKQTQLSIAYNRTKLDVNQKVNTNFKNASVNTVMQKLLQGTGFGFRREGSYIIITTSVTDNKVHGSSTVKGKIVDSNGEPIIGASVVEKGTTNGTITDIDGNFVLSMPNDKGLLNVSYVGYLSQTVKTEGNKSLNIVLKEDTQILDEVVVVGYGTEKKINVIGSIVQVGAEKLHDRSTPQLSNALAGQMSGVTVIQRTGRPGASGGEIRVRGVGSFGGSDNKSDALVLVDGIPGDLNTINAEDVESISVLKDASTAAIYGSRAANGVILVTTKTGQEGKIAVSYNGYVGFTKPTELPDFVDTWEYATIYNEAVGREAYTAEDIQKYKDGSDPDHYANARYLDELFSRNGLQTGHDVTINGGNKQNKYMISFGYLRQNGIIETNDFTRYNARVNVINELSSKLKLTTRLSGLSSQRNEPLPAAGDDGDNLLSLISKAVRFPGLTPSILSDGSFGLGREGHGTPYGWVKSGSFLKNPVFSVNANVRLDYQPIKDLVLSAIGAYTYTNGESRTYRATMKLSDGRLLGPSNLTHSMGKTTYQSFQSTADYNKTFGKHSIGVLAGYSWEQEDYRGLTGYRDNFPGNDLPYLNAGAPDNQQSSGGGYGWALQSYFGRAKYNFDQRYLFESTVRYDGSSRFSKNKRFGFFPSVALGWRLSEEKFIKENEKLGFIDNLKLKASWGRLGNQNIGNYPYQSVYVLGQDFPFGGSLAQGAAVTTAVDPNIKWEETETVDGGFEAVLWKGLLSFNVSYFHRNTYDILYKPSGSISSVLGQNVSEMNTGKLKNSGWEFEVGHRNKIGKVSYSVNANLSIIQNKLTTLGVGNVTQLNGLVGNGSDLFVGYPIQMYYGYLSDGVFLDQADITSWVDQTKITPKPQPGDIRYKDISGPDGVPDGKVDPNYDRVYLGSRIPKYTFGLSLSAAYQGFDVSVLLQGVAGVKGRLEGFAGYAFRGDGNIQRWQADGRFRADNPTRYPAYPRVEDLSNSVGPNIELSDFWLLDASYVRMKNLQVGYTVPSKWLKSAKISGLRVYVQAENALSWNKYRKGWDPEQNTDGNYYPILGTYTFGVNLNF